MRILILSDLHSGTKSRTKDLCPYPQAKDKDDKLISSFFESAKDYTSNKGAFDYIIVPGDLTNQANLIEFECASKFLDRLSTEFSIPMENFIIVPGNHDVDWSVFDGKTIYDEERPYRVKHKYNTLLDSDHSISRICTNGLTKSPYLKHWEFDNIVFWGYNSSWHDDVMKDKHYGFIDLEHIEILKEQSSATKFNGKLKVFVIHHHVYQYPNPHPRWIDISCLQNSQSLITALSEASFSFVIHGHRHVPNFVSNQINGLSTLNLFCAGSYSCEVPSDIAGVVGNLYHIIEFDDVSKCKGRIISKAYNPTEYRWVDSKKNHGIEHINSFGSELSFNQILNTCDQIIQKELEKSNSPISFEVLTKQVPDLNYTHVNTFEKIVKELEIKYNLNASTFADQDRYFIKKK